MDHFWVEVKRQFNLKQAKNAGNRGKRNGTLIGLLFEIPQLKYSNTKL